MNIGVQLRVYRKSRNHSVQKVSELTGISADKLYKWEKGTRPSDAEDLLKIREYMAGKLVSVPKNGSSELESKPKQQEPTDPLTGAHVTLQDHINLLKDYNEKLFALLSSNLGNLQEGQRAMIAYQKAWVDHIAEQESGGDPDKKEEIKYRFGRLVDDILSGVVVSCIQTGTGKQRKA